MEKDKFFHELLAGTENHYKLRATKKTAVIASNSKLCSWVLQPSIFAKT